MTRHVGNVGGVDKGTKPRPVSMVTLRYLVSEGKLSVARSEEIAQARGKKLGSVVNDVIASLKNVEDLGAYLKSHPEVLAQLLHRRTR